MSDEFSDLLDVIGSGASVNGAQVERVRRLAAAGRGTVHPLVGRDVLERPSPTPFQERPDPKYAELDSGDPLFMPRYLVREWGWNVFAGSAYYKLWEAEATRNFAGRDLLPSELKKEKR